MQLTTQVAGALALILSVHCVTSAAQPPAECDATRLPNWRDCDAIMYGYTHAPGDTQLGLVPGFCTVILPPPGIDATMLNCRMTICGDQDMTSISYDYISTLYATVNICETLPVQPAGGEYHSPDGYTMMVYDNPDYYLTKRDIGKSRRSGAGTLERRASSQCAGGQGSLSVVYTAKGVSAPGSKQFITILPPSGTYMTQQTDQKSVTVETSIGVEAGFFDLFSASAGVTVSNGMSVASTVGISVSNPCNPGQDAAVYLAPLFTEYACFCEDDQSSIEVYVPDNIQNVYEFQCLG